ncbi:MAG: T9SS type A sorting domain-containing protein, partial [Bacteroidetes bacterium]|nr:T9SS type A sorting domain-containing protein [Bacteroidota bacterium]
NLSISNKYSQSGDNYIDGNHISGNFSLTHASVNYDMYEGYGSPSNHADVIGGNTTMYLTNNKTLHSSNVRPTQFGGDLTVSHTGSGALGIFETSASIGGNFSLTSSAGSDYLNSTPSSKVAIGGTVNIAVTSFGEFNMQFLANNAPGGTVSIDSPSNVTLRNDTLKSNTSVTGYNGAGYFYDNSITGNLSISNKYTQSGDNIVDGNHISGNFSLTQTSQNYDMYEGHNSPSSHGMYVVGNTTINLIGSKSLITDYVHGGVYDGDFTVNHTGGGNLTLFNTTASIGGNFNLNATGSAGQLILNSVGTDIVDVGGSFRLIKNNPSVFEMHYIRNHGTSDTVSITGSTNYIDLQFDTLNSVVLLKNFSSDFYLYNNKFNGETLIADASGKSGNFYIDGNFFNGKYSLVHSSSNVVYDGLGGAPGFGNRVSGVDSIVNLSGAGAINIGYIHSHEADSSFILNSAGNVAFSASNPLIFGGATNGDARNYGTQALVIPRVTLVKTGNATMNLNAPLSISTLLTFTSGYINSPAATPLTFIPGSGYSGAATASHVKGLVTKVGNTAFTFPTGNGTYYAPCGITAPSAASDTFTAQYMQHNPGNDGYDSTQKVSTLNHLSRCEYWLINRGSSSSSNVKVTLGFTQHSGVNNLTDLTVAHWYAGGSGTKWYDEGNGSTTGTVTNGTITSSSTISSFSPFTLASTTTNNPLPVTLTDFNVTASGHTAIITWRSGLERGDETFLVQRSIDGEHFSTLGTQASLGSGHNYSYVDPMPAIGLNYYRLAIEEPGMLTNYGTTKMLRFSQAGIATDILLYPNPATESIFVDGLATHAGAIISIRSIVGQLLYQETLSADPRVEISLHNLPAGVYQLQIDDEQGSFYRQRFIRQ